MSVIGIDHLGVTWCVADAATVSNQDKIRRFSPITLAHDAWLPEDRGFYSYDQSLVHATGCRIMWSSSRSDMGVHVAMNGRALQEIDAVAELRRVAMCASAHITRIDINVDFSTLTSDETLPVSYYETLLDVGEFVGRKRDVVPVGTERRGKTIYVGSRSSDAYMRVYDKAKEQGGLDFKWIRFELVIKGQKARSLTDRIRGMVSVDKDSVRNLLLGLFKSFIWFDTEDFRRLFEWVKLEKIDSKKHERATLAWLNSIIPTLARQAVLHPGWYAEFRAEFESKLGDIKEEILRASLVD